MRLILVTVLVLAFGVYGLFFPSISFCLYILNNVFRPLDFAYAGGALPMANIVIVVLLLSILINLVRSKIRFRVNFFFVMTVIFLLWILVSAMKTNLTPLMYVRTPIEGFIEITKYLLPIAFIPAICSGRKDTTFLTIAIAFSVGVWGFKFGLGGLQHGTNEFMGIPGGQLGERNFFAAAVASVIPLIFYFFLTYQGKFKMIINPFILMASFLNLFAIMFSGSRGGVVAVGGMLFTGILLLSKNKIRDLAIVLVLAIIVVQFLPKSFFERMNTIEIGHEQTEGSAHERSLLMKSAFKATLDFPVFGTGPYCWMTVSRLYSKLDRAMQPHCMWLLCSSELGITGLVIFLAIIFYILIGLFRTIRNARRVNDKNTILLGSSLFLSIIGYSVGQSFLNFYFQELYWMILATAQTFILNIKEQNLQLPTTDELVESADPTENHTQMIL